MIVSDEVRQAPARCCPDALLAVVDGGAVVFAVASGGVMEISPSPRPFSEADLLHAVRATLDEGEE